MNINDHKSLLEYIDDSVRPQDDFFRYVNGKWLHSVEIPEDKAKWGSFHILTEKSLTDVRSLLESENSDSNFLKAKKFYKAGLNYEKRDQDDFLPIKPYLKKINTITTRKDLVDVIISLSKHNLVSILNFRSVIDRKNTNIEIPHIISAGINLPEREYYLSEEKTEIREKYKIYLSTLFEFIGLDQASKESAQKVLQFETKMAEKHYTQTQKRDPVLSYNPFEYENFNEVMKHFDYISYFSSYADLYGFSGTKLKNIIVDNPEFLQLFDTLLEEESIDNWKIYLTARLLHENAPYLSKRFEEANFEFFGKILGGTKIMEPDWKRLITFANQRFVLGELIGKFYVEKFFSPQAKEKMEKLVDNLLLAMEERINGLDWMSEETKEKALKKLAGFSHKIGYPEEFEDYSSLYFENEDSYYGMVKKCVEFHKKINFSRLYKEPDNKKWNMSPQTVNAYFHPLKNEIVFPASILQFPFFELELSDAENYGAIGIVIAHEITHGFDDKGSLFDHQGNMKNWWTEDDRKRFQEKSQYFIQEYEKYLVNGKPLKGKLTLGENIADHGGIKVALHAYKKFSTEFGDNKLNESQLLVQQFFLSFARVWRGKERPEFAEQARILDPHSPPKARVNVTLTNIKDFHEAFDVQEKDKMFRSELPVMW